MNGLRFDFATNDLIIESGSFATANIDNQTVALISISQICRLTRPELGAQLPSKLINRKVPSVSSILLDAVTMAENDGATNVSVRFIDSDNLQFLGTYENRT